MQTKTLVGSFALGVATFLGAFALGWFAHPAPKPPKPGPNPALVGRAQLDLYVTLTSQNIVVADEEFIRQTPRGLVYKVTYGDADGPSQNWRVVTAHGVETGAVQASRLRPPKKHKSTPAA
jgi:hypothetical protein